MFPTRSLYKKPIHVVFLEGNLAAGKTTNLNNFRNIKLLQEKYQVTYVDEIFEDFNSFKTFCPLDLCCQDPVYNCVATQIHITVRINRHLQEIVEKATRNDTDESKPLLLVCDRSILSPIVFIWAYQRMRYASQFSCDFLTDLAIILASKTIQTCNLKLLGIVYLHTPVEVCLERVKARNRSFEKNVTNGYLQTLEECYKDYLAWWTSLHGEEFILRVNTDEELCGNLRDFVDTRMQKLG